LFLSKAERDYLLSVDRQKTNHDYVCVKSRLRKKLKVFVDQELPLLLEKGYLSDIADFRDTSAALVAQLGRELPLIEKDIRKESLGGDLDPRPLPYQGNALPG
jgi:hypothetical protein